MNWETFRSLEEAMACVRYHEEVSNNRYVIVKRRKRGKSIIHNVYFKKRATERVSETDSDRQKYNPTVQQESCIVLCPLHRAAVSAFSLVVLLVMLCEVAYMFGYLSK